MGLKPTASDAMRGQPGRFAARELAGIHRQCQLAQEPFVEKHSIVMPRFSCYCHIHASVGAPGGRSAALVDLGSRSTSSASHCSEAIRSLRLVACADRRFECPAVSVSEKRRSLEGVERKEERTPRNGHLQPGRQEWIGRCWSEPLWRTPIRPLPR